MGNRDLTISRTYTYKTFQGLFELLAEGHGEEGDPGEPLKFKIYRDRPRYPLSQALSLTLGDVRCSFAEFSRTHRAARPSLTLDVERLSVLLYYSYGFSRHDTGAGVRWPFHRFVASARCFFPTELYLWIPQTGAIPAGLYHYDNLHHSLTQLREGDVGDLLGSALDTRIDGCAAILLLSARFWKTAFRYRNFAYRLCTQEAGMVAGNALIVAGTLGLCGHVLYQFLDRPLNQLLGLEEFEESLMAAIPLYRSDAPAARQHERAPTMIDAQELLERIPLMPVCHVGQHELDRTLCMQLTEIDQNSFLERTAEFIRAPVGRPVCADGAERIFPPPLATKSLELAQALHARNSGDMVFVPLHTPISRDVFWEIVRYALSPFVSDLNPSGAPPQVQLYIAVNHVEDLAAGVYRLCSTCGALHVVGRGDVSRQIEAIYSQPTVTCRTANMVCYIVADLEAARELLGNRSYRILNMESGLIAQRLCVMSAAYGLTARCSDSYFIDRCASLLELTGSPLLPIFQIIIGSERPGAGSRYRFSIRF